MASEPGAGQPPVGEPGAGQPGAGQPPAAEAVLSLRGLAVEFAVKDMPFRAVDGVTLDVLRGRTLALVGESGSGKSVTIQSVMRLLKSPARIAAGEIVFRGRDGERRDLAQLDERHMRKLRGNEIGLIFQEPMTSLNPLLKVGVQIAQAVRLHGRASAREAGAEVLRLLRQVEIGDAAERAAQYPHQLSGGMRQRVMIAMALACRPVLLLADEPTTALDVTVQAQILHLLRSLQEQLGMGILFVTHNLGVVAEIADHVAVMYGGQIVESAPVERLFDRPLHPYTRALLASRPDAAEHGPRRRLAAMPGEAVDPRRLPPGCRFEPRCARAWGDCRSSQPATETAAAGHEVRCVRWSDA
jgi:peptide/nickel transport system ATP-binding protein/oligopeptide transport system ATP-binding protein